MKKKSWNGYAQAEFKVALNYDPKDKIALKNYKPSNSVKNRTKKTNIGLLDKIKSFFKSA